MNILTQLGEPNENGPRIPDARGEQRAQFQEDHGEFRDGRYQFRWHPYNSRQQFRMARRNVFPIIPTRASIDANCVGRYSDRLHPTEQKRKFKSVEHFFSCLDQIAERVTPWRSATQLLPKPYNILYRNSLEVLQELIGDTTVGPHMKWAPVRRSDDDHNRVYTEIYTANWWWDQQEVLHPDQEVPDGGSRMIIPLIISSDKTVYGALSGDAYAWPLYLSVGNIPSEHRWKPTRPHWRAIAFIKDPQGNNFKANCANIRAH